MDNNDIKETINKLLKDENVQSFKLSWEVYTLGYEQDGVKPNIEVTKRDYNNKDAR